MLDCLAVWQAGFREATSFRFARAVHSVCLKWFQKSSGQTLRGQSIMATMCLDQWNFDEYQSCSVTDGPTP